MTDKHLTLTRIMIGKFRSLLPWLLLGLLICFSVSIYFKARKYERLLMEEDALLESRYFQACSDLSFFYSNPFTIGQKGKIDSSIDLFIEMEFFSELSLLNREIVEKIQGWKEELKKKNNVDDAYLKNNILLKGISQNENGSIGIYFSQNLSGFQITQSDTFSNPSSQLNSISMLAKDPGIVRSSCYELMDELKSKNKKLIPNSVVLRDGRLFLFADTEWYDCKVPNYKKIGRATVELGSNTIEYTETSDNEMGCPVQ